MSFNEIKCHVNTSLGLVWRDASPASPPVSAPVACLVFPTFSVFKIVYHEHPFGFSPSAMSVMPYIVSGTYILGWPYLRLDQKCLSRLAEYYDVIRGPPF